MDPRAASILGSKDMRVIFQKKGKKWQNIWKFGLKCTKFKNILKKNRWLRAIIAQNKLLEKARKSEVEDRRYSSK